MKLIKHSWKKNIKTLENGGLITDNKILKKLILSNELIKALDNDDMFNN